MNTNLIEEEIDDLLNIYEGNKRPKDLLQLKNRSFDVLTEENARFWTRFNKDQLVTLYEHLRIPNIVQPNGRGGGRRLSGRELFIFSLTKIAHGSINLALVPVFGGDPHEYLPMFKWFIKHIFITFCNKILGKSLEMWLNEVLHFRETI